MKKKYLILCSLLVIVLFATFCFYKLYLLNRYPVLGKGEIEKVLSNLSEMPIVTDRALANTRFYDMNIYIPEDMINNTPSVLGSDQVTYSRNDDSAFSIYITKLPTWYKSLDEPYEGISSADVKAILEKYRITSDHDVIDYYKGRIGNNNNIFTSRSRIIADHWASVYIFNRYITRGNSNNPYVLTGDLAGTIGDTSKDLSIVYVYSDKDDGISYCIWLVGTEEEKSKILKSIYFE